MSYDVSFAVKEQSTGKLVILPELISNITWNVKELIKQSSGWEIKNESENGLLKELIPKIRKGLENLMERPAIYSMFESPNGWGTVNGVLKFYRDILIAYDDIDEFHFLYDVKDYLYLYID